MFCLLILLNTNHFLFLRALLREAVSLLQKTVFICVTTLAEKPATNAHFSRGSCGFFGQFMTLTCAFYETENNSFFLESKPVAFQAITICFFCITAESSDIITEDPELPATGTKENITTNYRPEEPKVKITECTQIHKDRETFIPDSNSVSANIDTVENTRLVADTNKEAKKTEDKAMKSSAKHDVISQIKE